MFFTIYKITNKLNGKFYYGCHKTADLDDGYMGSGTYLKHAIKKHGVENFSKKIVALCCSEAQMFQTERDIVALFLGHPLCYNIAEGGNGGWSLVNDNVALRAELSAKASEERKLRVGTQNPIFGKRWVSNKQLGTSALVEQELISTYLEQGWHLGRTMLYDYTCSQCQQLFTTKTRRRNKSKAGLLFCSTRCSAKFTDNLGRANRSRTGISTLRE